MTTYFVAALIGLTVLLSPCVHAVSVCYIDDTSGFMTCDGRKITFQGILMPKRSEPHGYEAYNYLLQLIQNKDVTLQCNTPGNSLMGLNNNGQPVMMMSGACYVNQFVTIQTPTGPQTFVNNLPCDAYLATIEPQACRVMTGPVDVQRQLVSQGHARDISGQYQNEQRNAQLLRLGIWR